MVMLPGTFIPIDLCALAIFFSDIFYDNQVNLVNFLSVEYINQSK